MNPRLTARDVAVIIDVYKYRYMSVSQVEALHFPSRRTAYRRLQALTMLGYLKSFTVPNISERVYYIDKLSVDVVAIELQVKLDDLRWNRQESRAPKDYYFLRHFLAINDFRIQLTLACENHVLSSLGFIPEYIGEKTVEGNVQKYLRDRVADTVNPSRIISHTPDAVFALAKEGNAALFFVEIDRGIEILNDPEKGFLKSIVFYLNYWVDGKYSRYQRDFPGYDFKAFRALIITDSQKRLQHMREAVTKYPFPHNQAKRYLWGATDVSKDNMFSPIWQSMEITDETTYQIG